VRRGALLTAVVVVTALAAAPSAHAAPADDVYASFSPTEVVLGNSLAERRWSRAQLKTTQLVDKRNGGRTWSRDTRDFAIQVGPQEIGSESFAVNSVAVTPLPRGGLRVTMTISGSGLTGTRVAEAYPGVAGFRMQTILTSPAPLAISAATLEQAGVGRATPAIHALRAGADWRDPEWPGPQVQYGDPHAGTWRETKTAGDGAALEGAAQWLDASSGGRRLFMVMERNDLPSSWASYDGSTASLRLEYTRDVISLGPFEEMIHVENENPEGGRNRTLHPGQPFALEPTFIGFGTEDADAFWQWSKYLLKHRINPTYRRDVTFNTNNIDSNKRSTGAKDDVDLAMVKTLAPLAQRIGIETFILDDGWQASSGDWCPDSPTCPEPRTATDPKFTPRFPDSEFKAVREALAPMRLGLWMSPLHFHPSAKTWQAHPEYICHPTGDGLLLYNTLDQTGGSNEAGLAQWSNAALGHVEARIREAIVKWGARYFKFDFMVWLDCEGVNDLYENHDAVLAMFDRILRDHPDVTLQVDETNDYRLFPFESVMRGPSWFQNGSPDSKQLLHNLWNLNPYVPGFSLGQAVLGSYKTEAVDTLMAAALPSHITFWSDLRTLPNDVIDRAATWLAFYKRYRDELSQMTYPLLEDPLKGGWTALQAWDPEQARGALYAFRQGADDGTKRIALRNVPPGLKFDLLEGPTGKRVDGATSAELTHGIDVTLASKGQARVLVIVPSPDSPPVPADRPPATADTPGSNPLGLPSARDCIDRRRFSFKLHRPQHTRIVRVDAFVNGKLVQRRKGKSIDRITLKKLPKTNRLVVRIRAFHSNGAQVISTRTYRGCKQGRPTTTHRPPKR
jgi:hypothetical protein